MSNLISKILLHACNCFGLSLVKVAVKNIKLVAKLNYGSWLINTLCAPEKQEDYSKKPRLRSPILRAC